MSWKTAALVGTFTIALAGAPIAVAAHSPARSAGRTSKYPPDTNCFLSGHAVGTQNYICASAATASGVDWLFIGPQATVFDADVQQILTHYQSKNPFRGDALHATWQDSEDTSAVWAVEARGLERPEYVPKKAIEWLLLEVTGAEVGPTGGNRVSGATFIQRVNTVGGLKPAEECTQSTLNSRKLVDYEADYYFYQ